MVKLIAGSSQKDRISFSSFDESATAIRKSNGEIDIKLGKINESPTIVSIILSIIFYATPLVKAYIIVPLIKNGILGAKFYLVAAFIYLFVAIFEITYLRITRGKEFLKNHAAEHKVYLAYKKLKRVPAIEEAKHFSRINKECGATIYSGFITIQIIAFIIYAHTGYMISEVILFVGAMLLRTIFPLNILGKLAQFFTTSAPEDANIELAIAAVSALETRQQFKDEISGIVKKAFKI